MNLTDPKAAPGLQLHEEPSREVGRPVNQFIYGVPIQYSPERRLGAPKGLPKERALAGIRRLQPKPFNDKVEEGCELRIAKAGRTAGCLVGEASQKRVDLLAR